MAYKDETNNTYGRLTVLREDGNIRKEKAWLCQCVCGSVVRIRGSSLRNGTTSSCGCYRSEITSKRSINILLGKRFGKLVVIERDWSIVHSVYWIVLCDCGCTFSIRGAHLTSSDTKQCFACGLVVSGQKRKTHGMSRTKQYRTYVQRIRDERKEILDVNWTFEMERAVHMYFHNSCVICGSTEKMHLDHVYPLSKGYGLKPGNAVLLCRHHNEKKNYLMPEQLPTEWRDKILLAAKQFKDAWNSGFRA